MAGNVNENKIVIPVLGVIYLASLLVWMSWGKS